VKFIALAYGFLRRLDVSALALALADITAPATRANDAEYHVIPAARSEELTPANGWPALDEFRTWSRSLGGPTSNRFSTLDQITPANVAQLEVAWTYNSKDGNANLQANPIVVDGVMFAPTAGHHIVAIDALRRPARRSRVSGAKVARRCRPAVASPARCGKTC